MKRQVVMTGSKTAALGLLALPLLAGCTQEAMLDVATSAQTCVETMAPDDLSCMKTLYTDVIGPATEPAAITAQTLLKEMNPNQP